MKTELSNLVSAVEALIDAQYKLSVAITSKEIVELMPDVMRAKRGVNEALKEAKFALKE